MGDVADAGQGFASEAVRPDRCEVFKCFEFGRREALAEDEKIITLVLSVNERTYHQG